MFTTGSVGVTVSTLGVITAGIVGVTVGVVDTGIVGVTVSTLGVIISVLLIVFPFYMLLLLFSLTFFTPLSLV